MYKFILLYIVFPVMLFAQASENNDTAQYKLDDVNIIGNRIAADKFNSTNSVRILTKEMIGNLNGCTAGDILAYEDGLFIKSYGGNGSLKTISSDGLGAEHTSILLNGVRLNSAQNSQFDLSLIASDNIERIEIVNDALSTAYGSGSTGGVINIMTADNNKKTGFSLKGAAGSYNYFRYFAGGNINYGDAGISVNFSKEKSDNNYAYHFNDGISNELRHRENSGYSINNLFSSFTYNHKSSKFDFSAFYTNAGRNLPGPETGNVSSYAFQKDEQLSLVYRYKNIYTDKVSLESSGGYRYSLQNYNDYFTPEYYKEGNYFINMQGNYLNGIFKMTGGTEVNYYKLTSGSVASGAERFQPAVYSLMEFNFGKIIIAPSVRYEYASDFRKSSIYGKAGINYKPFENENFHMRFCIANGGRVPTFNELYWVTGGNRNLKPEKSLSLQTGFIYSFDFYTSNTVELSYTNIKISDKILWKPVNGSIYWSPLNVSESESDILNINFDIIRKISKNIFAGLKFGYTYNKAVNSGNDYAGDSSEGRQLIYIPVEIVQSSLNLKIYDFSFNLLYTFTGKRYINEDNSLYMKGVDIFGANAGFTQKIFNVDFNIKFEINNLLDSDYQVIPGYPAPLRNYKLELNLNY